MYLLMTYIRKERKTETNEPKNLAGQDKVIEAVTTPKRGQNRAKIIAQFEVVALSE